MKNTKRKYKNFEQQILDAQNQPGIKDVFAVYGEYNELLTQSQEYLGIIRKTESFSTNNSSQ